MSPKNRCLPGFDNARLVGIILYFLVSMLLFRYYKYQINPDGVSYINIAEKYLRLDFSDAVNGYWGPLMSWLMVPFLAVGIKPLIAARILLVVIGAGAVIHADSLLKLFQIQGFLRNAALCLIAVIVISYAYGVITPDLLFTALSLALLSSLIKSSYTDNKYAGVKCGMIGAALYLSKSYGFPFFIVNFFIFNFVFLIRKRKSREELARISVNFISGMIAFLIISTPWILIISSKYDRLTIGTSGRYNHSIVGPHASWHPMHYMGLLDPPNKTATSVWEDPTNLDVPKWSMFESSASFKHQIGIVSRNIIDIYRILMRYSFLALPLLVIASVLIAKEGKKFFFNDSLLLLVSLLVLFAGYALVVVDARYLWLGNIIAIIIGADLLELLFKRLQFKLLPQIMLVIVVSSFLVSPVQELYSRFRGGKDLVDLSNSMKPLDIKGRIASNTEWQGTLHLSFFNGWKYFGEKGSLSKAKLYAQLKDKLIDYYFLWEGQSNEESEFLVQYKEVSGDSWPGLKIYRLR